MNRNEVLDVVNDADEVVGQASIGEVHDEALVHRVVHVVVVRNDEVLFQKRSPACFKSPNVWEAAVGGHVPAGSSYEEAARKELLEETGLTCEITRTGFRRIRELNEKENAAVFVARATGEPRLSDESSEQVFVPLSKVNAFASKHDVLEATMPSLKIALKGLNK